MGLGVPPYKGSKYKVHPYVFAGNISFHVLDISRFRKVGVGELCVCVGGGGGGAWWVVLAHGLHARPQTDDMHMHMIA